MSNKDWLQSVTTGEWKSRLYRKDGTKLWRALNPIPPKNGFHTLGNSQPLNDSDMPFTQIISV